MKRYSVLLIFMVLLSACKIDYDSEYASGGCLFSFYGNSNGIVFAGMEKAVREDEFFVPSHIYGLPVIGVGNLYLNTDIFNSQVTNLEYVKKLEIPSTVEIIFASAFECHDELESVRINSAKEIKQHAFFYCTKLSQIILPENLVTLGSNVFYNCRNLTDIILPQSTTNIGKNIFGHCNKLKTITVLATTPPSLSFLWSEDASPNDFIGIYVPSESVDLYKNASGWKDYADKIFSIGDVLYTVRFFTDGGSEIEDYRVASGKTIVEEPVSVKKDFAFAGWFLDKEFTQKVEFPFEPQSDCILYAEFVPPPQSTNFTYSKTSSSITVNISPSTEKYFDSYKLVIKKHNSSIQPTRAVPAPDVLKEVLIKETQYSISGLSSGHYYSVSLYVLDKFGQISDVCFQSFKL